MFDINRLRLVMLKKRDKIPQAAKRCGLSVSMIHAYLTGKTLPSLQSIDKLAKGYKKRRSFFLP